MTCSKRQISMRKAGTGIVQLFLPLILFIAGGQALYPQGPVKDTFETWVNREKNDSLRLERAIRVAKYFDNIDSAVAWKYYSLSKQIAGKQNTPISRIAILELEG